MVLVTCRECKAEVSSTAETCPRCGIRHPFKGANEEHLFAQRIVAILVLAFLAFFVVPMLLDLWRSF